MDERHIQRRITQALLETIATTEQADPAAGVDSPRDWAAADPYIIRHLAAHAVAAQRLGGITSDPGYLAAADPTRLIEALGDVTSSSYPHTQVYWRAAHHLVGASPAQRSRVLRTTAFENAPDLVADFPAPDALAQAAWADMTPASFHRTLTGHDGAVAALAFGMSAAGTPMLASSGNDSTVRLWDPRTGGPGAVLTGHRGPVAAVVFGTMIDGTAIVASAVTGNVRRVR